MKITVNMEFDTWGELMSFFENSRPVGAPVAPAVVPVVVSSSAAPAAPSPAPSPQPAATPIVAAASAPTDSPDDPQKAARAAMDALLARHPDGIGATKARAILDSEGVKRIRDVTDGAVAARLVEKFNAA